MLRQKLVLRNPRRMHFGGWLVCLSFWHSTACQKVSCWLLISTPVPCWLRGQRIPVSNASSLLFSVVQVAALLCLATERQYGLGGVSERSLFGTLGSLALYSLTVKVHMGTEETLRWHFNTKSCGWWGSPGHLSLSGWGWPEANLTPEPGV